MLALLSQHCQLNYYKQNNMYYPINPNDGQTTIVNNKLYTYNKLVNAWLVQGSSDPLEVTDYSYELLPDGSKRSILISDQVLDPIWDNLRTIRDLKIAEVEWRYSRFARNARLQLEQVDTLEALDTYVQALADITKQADPYHLIWPNLV